jgi:hypothetical protein
VQRWADARSGTGMIPHAWGPGEPITMPGRPFRARVRETSLRRASDRAESAMVAVLIAVFVAGGALLGVAAGRWTDTAAVRQAQAQSSWHQVRAVLAARGTQGLADFGGDWSTLSAPARWTAGGRQHAGRVPAGPGDRPGQAVRVWVNAAGQPVNAPAGRAGRPLRIGLAVTGTELGLALILGLAGCAGRWALDRRRMADWDRAWRATAPLWTAGPR